MSKLRTIFNLLRDTFKEWNEDGSPRIAAALAYYTTFSIAPLLIVVIAISGVIFGAEAVTGKLDEQIQGLIGREGADFVQEVIRNSRKPDESFVSTIIGVVTLLLGAAGVFGQLKFALNTVWDVPVKKGGGIMGLIKDHLLSFGMVLGIGFLLIVSLVASAGLAATGNFVTGLLPEMVFVTQVINFAVSFAIITILFAMLYKFLPDIKIEWRDVFVGAAVTSLLFSIGKQILGLYLGNSGIASPYGAAGSLVIMLVWIYYSAQIFLFGAEFTQVYARRVGSKTHQSHLIDNPQAVPAVPGATEKPSTAGAISTALMVIDQPERPEDSATPEEIIAATKPVKPIVPVVGLGIAAVSFVAAMVLGVIDNIRGRKRHA